MKKNTLFLISFSVLTLIANAQTTVFKETFGTPTTQKGENIVNHVWDNAASTGITYSWTRVDPAGTDTVGSINIRTNNPSDSLVIGGLATASGHGNLYFNAKTTNSFTISGINTASYNNINLTFMTYGKNKADVTLLKLQYDSGSGLIDAGTTQIAALSTTKGTWQTLSNITLPASSSLTLKFSTPTTNSLNLVAGVAQPIEIRIDDVKITGTSVLSALNSLKAENSRIKVLNSTLSLKEFTSGNIEIYNIQGKKVFTSDFKETIKPLLAKGIYIIKIGDYKQKISL